MLLRMNKMGFSYKQSNMLIKFFNLFSIVKTYDAEAVGRLQPKYSEAERETAENRDHRTTGDKCTSS
jgi:hypothetical protein